MTGILKRSAAAFTIAIATSAALGVVAVRAQTAAAGPGVQIVGPSSAAPAQMPSILSDPPPLSTPAPSGAPLASSTSSCQSDLARISNQRTAAIQELNKIAKANKGKLDPVAACPKFRILVKVENTFRDYLKQNKDWCGVPDEMLDGITQSAEKDAAVSQKACALAVQFTKAQAQAAMGLAAQAPKLPAGPL